jgi:hypothetical protein
MHKTAAKFPLELPLDATDVLTHPDTPNKDVETGDSHRYERMVG